MNSGPMRQRWVFPVLVGSLSLLLLLTGCMKPKTNGAAADDSAGSSGIPKLVQAVAMADGSMTAYPSQGPHEPVYKIAWKSAQAEGSGSSDFTASAKGVSGSLFDKGTLVSRFTADRASIDRKAQLLLVQGNVRVVSARPGPLFGSVLTCSEIKYTDARRLIEASGNVKMDGPQYSIGPFEKLVAAPDLSRVGTPDAFSAMNHNPSRSR